MKNSAFKSSVSLGFNQAAVSRIQSATARVNHGSVPAGSFAARAQAAFAKSPASGPKSSPSTQGPR